jgi:uroporphyrinogen decarboxylase
MAEAKPDRHAMTSRERVLAALTGGGPDRVPYLELYIDENFAHRALGLPAPAEPAVMSGELPVTVAYFGGNSYAPLDLARAIHLDGLLMSVQPRIYFKLAVSDGQKFVVDGLIHRREDLSMIDLPDPDDERIYEPARAFLQKHRSSGLAMGCFINLGSDPVILSMGWDHFSYALYDDPELLHRLFAIYSGWTARALKYICGLGFDFIWAGDDIAFKSGPMISPRVFRQFFMPYYRQVAEAITLPWIFHTDGNFLALLEDLLSLGMNALHPLEPDAVEIGDVKQRVAGRAGLVGNLDISALEQAAPQEMLELTRQRIQIAAPGGRYILSSSNSLTRACRVENVLAMVQARDLYGVYPLGLK